RFTDPKRQEGGQVLRGLRGDVPLVVRPPLVGRERKGSAPLRTSVDQPSPGSPAAGAVAASDSARDRMRTTFDDEKGARRANMMSDERGACYRRLPSRWCPCTQKL